MLLLLLSLQCELHTAPPFVNRTSWSNYYSSRTEVIGKNVAQGKYEKGDKEQATYNFKMILAFISKEIH